MNILKVTLISVLTISCFVKNVVAEDKPKTLQDASILEIKAAMTDARGACDFYQALAQELEKRKNSQPDSKDTSEPKKKEKRD